MTSFAVVTPSRGLVHSRAVEGVMTNIDEAIAAGHLFLGWKIVTGLPIPDSHNEVARAGLATGAEALWFVEEDVVSPSGALLHLLDRLPIAAVNYPVGYDMGWSCIARDPEGHIFWCGLGCTIIASDVFARIEQPWFSTDTAYRIVRKSGGGSEYIAFQSPEPPEKRYGRQDIYFFNRCREAGYVIEQVPDLVAGHEFLRSLGARETNHGCHSLELHTEIRLEQFV
jgi:hypothetical protein